MTTTRFEMETCTLNNKNIGKASTTEIFNRTSLRFDDGHLQAEYQECPQCLGHCCYADACEPTPYSCSEYAVPFVLQEDN